MSEDVELLDTYNYEWCEQIMGLRGWKEKKDKLDILLKISDATKLAQGDYTELVSTLKNLVNDNN